MKPAHVTETLHQRLARELPGAATALIGEHTRVYATVGNVEYRSTHERWQVTRDGKVLGVGHTEREAIDRACFLWGRR